MSDHSHIIHSVEQPSFEELREQFRADNRKRVHALLREDSITFRDREGQLLRDRDGNVVRRKTGYLTDASHGRDHRRFDEARAQGQRVPEFSKEFRVVEGTGLEHELRDLSRDAQALWESKKVVHPEVKSLEGPALESLDEEAVVNYLNKKETNGPEAKCSSDAKDTTATSTG